MKSILLTFLMVLSLGLSSLPAHAQGASPKQAYLNFLRVVYYAKDVKEIAPFMWKGFRDHFDKQPIEQREATMKTFKSMYAANVRIDKEEVHDGVARLTGKGIAATNGTTGKTYVANIDVEMVYEEGGWKLKWTTFSGLL